MGTLSNIMHLYLNTHTYPQLDLIQALYCPAKIMGHFHHCIPSQGNFGWAYIHTLHLEVTHPYTCTRIDSYRHTYFPSDAILLMLYGSRQWPMLNHSGIRVLLLTPRNTQCIESMTVPFTKSNNLWAQRTEAPITCFMVHILITRLITILNKKNSLVPLFSKHWWWLFGVYVVQTMMNMANCESWLLADPHLHTENIHTCRCIASYALVGRSTEHIRSLALQVISPTGLFTVTPVRKQNKKKKKKIEE